MAKRKLGLREQMEQPWFKQAQKRLPGVYQQFGIEVRCAHDAMMERQDYAGTWRHLERAHILGQTSVWRHLCIHFVMLTYALMRREFREAIGQVPRLIWAAPATLMGRAPRGNTGRSNVGMFDMLPLPKDLERILK